MIERTLVLLKPDAVERCIIGEIITRFEKAGLKIVGMKMVWVDKRLSRKHYKEHVKKPFYPGLERYITAGPVVAIAIEGVHAVSNTRKIVGETSSHKSLPGTIRGDFGHMSIEFADKSKRQYTNLIHASSDIQSAKREISLWFNKNELHSYKTVHEKHVFGWQ
ncbi:MAG: nucleoside-diphosphate kinase [Candidatus Woesearchaeota archaeon]